MKFEIILLALLVKFIHNTYTNKTASSVHRDLQTSFFTCGKCLDENYYYCQSITKGFYYINSKGECDEELGLENDGTYYCDNKFYSQSSAEYWSYFPCPFFTVKCGVDSPQLVMEDAHQEIVIQDLEEGDACIYEISYDETTMLNSNYKVWFSLL